MPTIPCSINVFALFISISCFQRYSLSYIVHPCYLQKRKDAIKLGSQAFTDRKLESTETTYDDRRNMFQTRLSFHGSFGRPWSALSCLRNGWICHKQLNSFQHRDTSGGSQGSSRGSQIVAFAQTCGLQSQPTTSNRSPMNRRMKIQATNGFGFETRSLRFACSSAAFPDDTRIGDDFDEALDDPRGSKKRGNKNKSRQLTGKRPKKSEEETGAIPKKSDKGRYSDAGEKSGKSGNGNTAMIPLVLPPHLKQRQVNKEKVIERESDTFEVPRGGRIMIRGGGRGKSLIPVLSEQEQISKPAPIRKRERQGESDVRMLSAQSDLQKLEFGFGKMLRDLEISPQRQVLRVFGFRHI